MTPGGAREILTFWFGDPSDPESEYGKPRRVWFCKDPAFDQQIRARFLHCYEQARLGRYSAWMQRPRGALALAVLLDQFPRNMFRGTARSFEADDQALAVAQAAISEGYDLTVLPVERQFLYLPFEHSENLEHQDQAVALFDSLVQVAPELQSSLDYAHRHREVIAQFGRFPHRNKILGRTSQVAEEAFLAQPGARF